MQLAVVSVDVELRLFWVSITLIDSCDFPIYSSMALYA